MNNSKGVNVYFIWYGNWSDSEAVPIVTDFIEHIGGTAYWNINTSYYDFTAEGEKDPIKNRVNYGGSIIDNYSYGSALTDDDIGLIIQDAATSGKLPYDLNGQYFILTSADVTETSGYCVLYCGFHGYQSLPNGDNLVGGFIGNPERCPIECTAQSSTPNNSLAADGMVTIIAHEVSESVTDPYFTGWINLQTDGSEDGDLCVWTFGKTKPLPNGSVYNVRFGNRDYLIQRLWVNARGGYCAMALDE
jgi:hypothetical protein